MIKLEFTEAEQQSLHYERYHHPHPRAQRKMEALRFKSHFQDFKQAISACLAQTHATYKKELDSLLTLKLQTFKEPQVMAA